jgi:hypothetical protein
MSLSNNEFSLYGLTEEQKIAVRTYQQIKMLPNIWKQDEWRDTEGYEETGDKTRCGAKLCFLGHVASNDFGQWATDDPDNSHFSDLIVREGDEMSDVEYLTISLSGFNAVDIPVISVMNRAASILGISKSEASDLSAPGNSLGDLRSYIKSYLNVDPENGNPVKTYKNEMSILGDRPKNHQASFGGCSLCNWERDHLEISQRYGR